MSGELGTDKTESIRKSGQRIAASDPISRKNYSTQKVINRLLIFGFSGMTAAGFGWLLIAQNRCSAVWVVLAVVLALLGMAMLISAWYVRQGLVHGRLMKRIIRMMGVW